MLGRFKRKISDLKEILLAFRLRILFENREEIQKKNIVHTRRLYYKKIVFKPLRIYQVLTGRELDVRYVEIVLTTICTLNCKGCSALMPVYPRDLKRHVDLEEIAKSIEGLTKSIDYVDRVRLLGGEPLLYPHLYDVLYLLQSQNKINQIEIITNGTLMIKDERVIEILKDGRFRIVISDYGKRLDNLIQQLKDEKINYEIYSRGSWFDFGEVTEKAWNSSELRDNFLFCKKARQQCISVLNGKLNLCPRASHGAYLGLIPLKEHEYIDLLDDTITVKQRRTQIFSFLYKTPPYIEACRYCEVSKKMNQIPVAEQIKR